MLHILHIIWCCYVDTYIILERVLKIAKHQSNEVWAPEPNRELDWCPLQSPACRCVSTKKFVWWRVSLKTGGQGSWKLALREIQNRESTFDYFNISVGCCFCYLSLAVTQKWPPTLRSKLMAWDTNHSTTLHAQDANWFEARLQLKSLGS